MAIAVVVLAIFTIYLIIKDYRSLYVRWLALITGSFCLSVIGTIIYASRYTYDLTSLWVNLDNFVVAIEYRLWTLFFDFARFDVSVLYRIINFSSAIFIYTVAGFSFVYTTEDKKQRRKALILLAIIPFWVVLINDPIINRLLFKIFINSISNTNKAYTIAFCIRFVYMFTNVIITAYLLYALYKMIRQYNRTRVKIKKHRILFITTEIIPVIVIFLMFFVWLPEKYYIFSSRNIQTVMVGQSFKMSRVFFDYMSWIIYSFIIINLFLLVRFNIVTTKYRMQNKLLKKSMVSANQNVRVIFHTIKNYFVSLKFISEAIQLKKDDGDNQKRLQEMHDMCQEMIEKINTLGMRLKVHRIDLEESEIFSLVDHTISRIITPPNISLMFNSSIDDVLTLWIDELLFSEVINAITANSIEACKENGGEIEVAINREQDWCIISIRDNGPGIDPKDLKKIFQPMYTTKNSKNNWGIGLSFAKSIITGHGGEIEVTSTLCKGTLTEIFLPIRR